MNIHGVLLLFSSGSKPVTQIMQKEKWKPAFMLYEVQNKKA